MPRFNLNKKNQDPALILLVLRIRGQRCRLAFYALRSAIYIFYGNEKGPEQSYSGPTMAKMRNEL